MIRSPLTRVLAKAATCLILAAVTPQAFAQEPLPEQAELRLGTGRWKAASALTKLIFSPDDAHLYSWGNVIQHWDAKTGELLQTLPAELGELIDLSPDGRWMLVGEVLRAPRLVDAMSGKPLRSLHKEPTSLAKFAPDGKHVLCALADEKTLVLRDLINGTEVVRFESADKRLSQPSFSADGKLVAAAEATDNLWNGSVQVHMWDAGTGKRRTRMTSLHQGFTSSLVFSADSTKLVVGSHQRVRVFDAKTGESLYVVGHQTRGQVAIEPKGAWCIAAGEGVLWDLRTDSARGRLEQPHDPIGAVAISHDGKTIATAGSAWGQHAIDLWDAATGRRKTLATRHRNAVDEVAFSPGGTTIATRSLHDGTIVLWDGGTGKPRHVLDWGPSPFACEGSLAFLDRGRHLMASGRRWATMTGEPMEDLLDVTDRPERLGHSPADRRDRQTIRISPDGRFAADLDMRRQVRVRDLKENRILFRVAPAAKGKLGTPNENEPIVYAFTPDNKTLVVAHAPLPNLQTPTIRLFDVPSGKLRSSYRPEGFHVYQMLCTPDGERLILSTRVGVEVRKLEKGDVLKRWPLPDVRVEPRSYAIALSPEGRLLAFVTQAGQITLSEMGSYKQVAAWPAAGGPIRAIAFRPDSMRLLTGSLDSSALLWRMLPDKQRDQLLKANSDEQLWTLLAGEPGSAFAVAWSLASTPDRARQMLGKRVHPVPEVERRQIQKWIDAQGDATFAVRDEAAKELRQRGFVVASYLREALKGNLPLEARRRIVNLLNTIETQGPSPEVMRDEHAIQILEMLGDTDARRLLEAVAKGAAGSARTLAAQAAIQRLRDR